MISAHVAVVKVQTRRGAKVWRNEWALCLVKADQKVVPKAFQKRLLNAVSRLVALKSVRLRCSQASVLALLMRLSHLATKKLSTAVAN
jgi:hypothetical protein